MKIKLIESDKEILGCFTVMKFLRPLLESQESFLEQVRRQEKVSYRILAAIENDEVLALAGIRDMENLVHGKFIYVDDLVTHPDQRGKNLGKELLLFVSEMALNKNMNSVILDTGLANSQAQKFYYREGFLGMGLHFKKLLK